MLFDLMECVDEASEQAGLELRTGFDWKSVRRSVALLMRDWSNRGYNLYAISERTLSTVVGQNTYAVGNDVLDVTDLLIRNNPGTAQQFDFSTSRLSVTDYINIPNKLVAGSPFNFATLRTTTTSVVLYPTPDAVYTIQYWVLKTLTDPSIGGDLLGMPERFIPAFISGIAYEMAKKRNPPRAPALQADYEAAFMRATDEDRDRASFMVTPMGARW